MKPGSRIVLDVLQKNSQHTFLWLAGNFCCCSH